MKNRTDNYIENLASQFQKLRKTPDDTGLAVEGMRILIQQEMEKRLTEGGAYLDCRIIELNQFSDFLNEIKKLKIPDKNEFRFQVIVLNGMHYTAIDFNLSAHANKCIVLDAAHDPRGMLSLAKILGLETDKKKSFFSKVYFPSARPVKPTENLQQDFFSCPMFSFDHVCQVSRLPDIYDDLKKISQSNPVKGFSNLPLTYWDDLPAQLVWNAQSPTFLKMYIDKKPNMDFKEYLAELKQDSMNPIASAATQRLFHQCSGKGLAYIEITDEKRLRQITAPTFQHEVAKLQESFARMNPKKTAKTNLFKSPIPETADLKNDGAKLRK